MKFENQIVALGIVISLVHVEAEHVVEISLENNHESVKFLKFAKKWSHFEFVWLEEQVELQFA